MPLKTSRGSLCVAAALLGAAGLSAGASAQTLSLTTVDTCINAGETTVTVAIDLAGAPSAVVGGQFFLQYDNTVLTFVSADPGDSPFTFELHENAGSPGTLDYATGVDPMPPGPPLPGVLAGRMAVLTFSVAGEACDAAGLVSFRANTPGTTVTDSTGADLAPTLVDLPAITIDLTPPLLEGVPADITIECSDPVPAAASPTASDGCDPMPLVSFDEATTAGACPQASTITRTWTATDACGNTSVGTQTITVVDTTAPAVVPPADVAVECGGLTDPSQTGSATAVDCDPSPTIGFSDSVAPGDCPQESIITRTWTATDACGNVGTAEQIITVTDTTAPSVTPPANVSVECGADISPTALGTATAADNCDGAPGVTFSDASDGLGCPETITRTWTATDACGNVGTAAQLITITDTTSPTFASVPADVTLECGENTDPSGTGEAVGQDNCGEPTVTFADAVAAGACPGDEVITRTWTATDACGLSISADQLITVMDTTAPTVTPPGDLVLECGDSTEPSATGTATASDACDAAPVVTYEDTVTPGCGGTTIITRTWSAADLCENIGTAVQTITVTDTTPPAFDLPCPLADVTVVADAGLCTAAASSVALETPTATDACGAATVTGSRSDGLTMADPFPSTAPVTVTWTAADDCGNTATCEQLVTVEPINEVDIAIDLEFGFESGPFTRCITFQFFACDSPPVVATVEAPVTFTSGVGQATVQIPCGQYVCATARDSRHTLRRTDADDFGTTPIVGTRYVADFTSSGDDDSLIGGNLNDDFVIDILDFGTFIGRFNLSDPADTPCPPTGTNADIDGDGSVFVEDFNFIFVNFLATSEANCCGQPGLAQPVVRISVAELIATGRGDLAVADLNNDGWLDEADVAAYLDGALVTCAADFNHDHALDIFDLLAYLDAWFAGDDSTDMNADGAVDNFDLLGYIDLWFAGC